jgi:hypothetical protein
MRIPFLISSLRPNARLPTPPIVYVSHAASKRAAGRGLTLLLTNRPPCHHSLKIGTRWSFGFEISICGRHSRPLGIVELRNCLGGSASADHLDEAKGFRFAGELVSDNHGAVYLPSPGEALFQVAICYRVGKVADV